MLTFLQLTLQENFLKIKLINHVKHYPETCFAPFNAGRI
jgi:hypothetical protein